MAPSFTQVPRISESERPEGWVSEDIERGVEISGISSSGLAALAEYGGKALKPLEKGGSAWQVTLPKVPFISHGGGVWHELAHGVGFAASVTTKAVQFGIDVSKVWQHPGKRERVGAAEPFGSQTWIEVFESEWATWIEAAELKAELDEMLTFKGMLNYMLAEQQRNQEQRALDAARMEIMLDFIK